MTVIHVPRPPRSAMNPDRPVSALLKTQIQHLYEAELKLPIPQQTNIYSNAIKTEGEAADYIRRVTAAIHKAHEAAEAKRARTKRKPGFEIAAAAERPSRKRSSKTKTKAKSSGSKRSRKK